MLQMSVKYFTPPCCATDWNRKKIPQVSLLLYWHENRDIVLQKKDSFITNEIILNKHAHGAVLKKPSFVIDVYEIGNGCSTDTNSAHT